MNQTPRRAQLYLLACFLAGSIALGWLLTSYQRALTFQDALLALSLGIIASLCQVLVVARVGTAGQRSDHLTLSPLFAAVLLLPHPLLAAVIIWTFIPEWYLRRRSWYGQVFNIAAFLLAAVLARLTLEQVTGSYEPVMIEAGLALWKKSAAVLLALVIFEGIQVLLLALVLKLARGQSFRTSGLFATDSLLLEVALLCMGLGFAISWSVAPLYGLLSLVPLVLIFQALHVPNLKEQAATDPKTGLANMRRFNEMATREIERAQSNHHPLSILMCDLDYLRNINNTYGHEAGDIVLLGIADTLVRHVRDSDVAARFGGEEFVILLPNTGIEGAYHLAERIRNDLASSFFDVGHYKGPIGATVSIGAASFPRDANTLDALMREADLAVYQAKREGRNRVVMAGQASRELAARWASEHLIAPHAVVTPAQSGEKERPFEKAINKVTGSSLEGAERRTLINNQRAANQKGAAHPTGEPQPAGPSRKLLLAIGATLVLGLLGLVPGQGLADIPWSVLLLFGILTLLAEQLAVASVGQGRISVSVVTILAASFLTHELGILVTVVAAVGSMAIKARKLSYKMAFNLGNVLLAAEAAHWVFGLLVGPTREQGAILQVLLAAALAGLVYHGVNQLLLCIVRGMAEERNPIEIWYTEYRWLWPHYVVLGALAAILAVGYDVFGTVGVISLTAPVAMMHLAMKQYLDHTRVYVDELRTMNDRLSESYEATLEALSRALDTRDDETEAHSKRVAHYTRLIAERSGVPDKEMADITRGALLHDIGKIGVPDAILLKAGPLTPAEHATMRQHPIIGYRMIVNIPFLSEAAQVVLHHHEAFDGSGYPSGLSGKSVPIGARIFAVADTFDAMTSDRPYRRALSVEAARGEISRCSGTQFDPQVVETFLTIPLEELMGMIEIFSPATDQGIGWPTPAALQASVGAP